MTPARERPNVRLPHDRAAAGDRDSRGAPGDRSQNRTSRGRPNGPSWRASNDAGSGSRPIHAPQPEDTWTRPANRSRRASRGSPSCRTRRSRSSRPGSDVLGLDGLDGPSRQALTGHLRLLAAWTGAINLTAIREPVAAVRVLLLDSLTAVPLLRAARIDAFVDLGSGGGFPGLPVAIALPARRVLLVDSVAKKARFLATASDALGMSGRVEAFAGRAESLAADRRHRERWPAVTARAVGALAELAELGLPLLAPGGLLVAWKRGEIEAELSAGWAAVAILGGGELRTAPVDERLGLPGHRLVVIEKVRPTPAGYPRDPAIRRRRPLG